MKVFQNQMLAEPARLGGGGAGGFERIEKGVGYERVEGLACRIGASIPAFRRDIAGGGEDADCEIVRQGSLQR